MSTHMSSEMHILRLHPDLLNEKTWRKRQAVSSNKPSRWFWNNLSFKNPRLKIQKTKIMESGPFTSWQIDGETVETVSDFTLGARKSLQMVTAAIKLKDAYS